MKTKKLRDLSDKELIKKSKDIKNGVDFFTFFPLFLAYIIIKNSSNNKLLEKEIEKEIASRNLK
jgi:hypothetical protein